MDWPAAPPEDRHRLADVPRAGPRMACTHTQQTLERNRLGGTKASRQPKVRLNRSLVTVVLRPECGQPGGDSPRLAAWRPHYYYYYYY